MRRILWGRATSSNVMKAIWTLEELHLPYERIDVGGSFGKTDTPEYRAMNPTGLVPTLQEGDFTLWESNATGGSAKGTAPGIALEHWGPLTIHLATGRYHIPATMFEDHMAADKVPIHATLREI
jgi:hypothetical protein